MRKQTKKKQTKQPLSSDRLPKQKQGQRQRQDVRVSVNVGARRAAKATSGTPGGAAPQPRQPVVVVSAPAAPAPSLKLHALPSFVTPPPPVPPPPPVAPPPPPSGPPPTGPRPPSTPPPSGPPRPPRPPSTPPPPTGPRPPVSSARSASTSPPPPGGYRFYPPPTSSGSRDDELFREYTSRLSEVLRRSMLKSEERLSSQVSEVEGRISSYLDALKMKSDERGLASAIAASEHAAGLQELSGQMQSNAEYLREAIESLVTSDPSLTKPGASGKIDDVPDMRVGDRRTMDEVRDAWIKGWKHQQASARGEPNTRRISQRDAIEAFDRQFGALVGDERRGAVANAVDAFIDQGVIEMQARRGSATASAYAAAAAPMRRNPGDDWQVFAPAATSESLVGGTSRIYVKPIQPEPSIFEKEGMQFSDESGEGLISEEEE